jgi:membrane-associated phospholipid phosphatase
MTPDGMILRSTTTMMKLENPGRATLSVYILGSAALLISGAAVLFAPDSFDRGLTVALNHFARRSYLFDAACHAISDYTIFSGLIFVSFLWYCWFSSPDLPSRYKVLSGTIASALAGMFSRLTQLLFPNRARPFQDASVHLKLPFTVKLDSLRHVASSFPSDHSALYFALAATVFAVNRKIGYYSFGLAVLLSAVRLYLGFHYLSDTIGGAALGVLCVCVIQNLRIPSLTKRVSAMCQAPSPAFYAVAYCVTYTIATMFYDVRAIASQLAHLIRH